MSNRDRSPLNRDMNAQAQAPGVMPLQKIHLDTIPEYDGNPATLAIFIQSAEYLINNFSDRNNLQNPQNEFLLRSVIGKLSGRALNLIGSRGNLTNWNSIKTLLLQFFSDSRDENCLVGDLLHIRQGKNENPISFGNRCQDLLSLLLTKVQLIEPDVNRRQLKIEIYEKQALDAFLRGLQNNLPIRLRNPRNLEEAIGYVREEENFSYAQNSLSVKQQNNFKQYNNFKPNIPKTNYVPNTQFSNQYLPRTFGNGQFNRFNQNFTNYNNTPNKNNSNSPPTYNNSSFYRTQNRLPNNPPIRFNQRNNFQNQNKNYPQPMDISSGNTVPSRFTRPFRPTGPSNFVSEELYQQEIETNNEPLQNINEQNFQNINCNRNNEFQQNFQHINYNNEYEQDMNYNNEYEQNFQLPGPSNQET